MGSHRPESFKLSMADPQVEGSARGEDITKPPNLVLASHEGGCWYLRGRVGRAPLELLVDTGATVDLLDYDVYCSLEPQYKTTLSLTTTNLHGVDGNCLDIKGETTIKFATHECVYSVNMVVAKLGSMQGILGMRFLKKETSSIDTVNGCLKCGDTSHQLYHVQARGCCRVRLSSETTLTGGMETLVFGHLENDGSMTGPVLLEPASPDLLSLGILMPKALVEAGPGPVPFTIANMGETLSLLPGTPIGNIFPVEVVACPGLGLAEGGKPEGVACHLGHSHTDGENPLESHGNDAQQESPALVPEHLQALYEQAIVGLTKAQTQEVAALLKREENMFVTPGGQLGRTHLVKHDIETGNAPPIKMGPRRQGPFLRKIVNEEVRKMLADGIIQPSSSPWSSPVVLSKKKDGTYRFCVDYRGLNNFTQKDAYPLPSTLDCIDSLSGAKCFCTLDLASGYWQVEMAETSRPKTAFVTHQGLFEFNVMSFGLTNAPATFERLMELALRGLQWQECLIFLDDIIIFGASFDETMARLQHVLGRFKEAGLKLKPSKCALFRQEVAFLGHVVNKGGVMCDPKKLEAVTTWPRPKNVTEVRSFLGFCSYYRRFVRGFAAIATPLTALTEKDRRFEWGQECQEAYEALRGALVKAPILAYPDPSLESPMILDTDASQFAIGAVLSQMQEGVERVIA